MPTGKLNVNGNPAVGIVLRNVPVLFVSTNAVELPPLIAPAVAFETVKLFAPILKRPAVRVNCWLATTEELNVTAGESPDVLLIVRKSNVVAPANVCAAVPLKVTALLLGVNDPPLIVQLPPRLKSPPIVPD